MSTERTIEPTPARQPPARVYSRERDLPRLLPLIFQGGGPLDVKDHLRVLSGLRRALRLERSRGIAGHWTYDLARHAALLRAYRAERAAYRERSQAWFPGDDREA